MNLNALSKLTILYAEDDNDTANLTSLVLEDYVGRLLVAKNGQEALNLFKLHKVDKAILPFLQADEIASKNLLINAISTFVGGKKIAIIQFLLSHCDKDNIFYGSYEDIIAHLNVSKPTIVKTFKQLIVIKIKNKVYKIHPDLDQNAKNNALKDSNP